MACRDSATRRPSRTYRAGLIGLVWLVVGCGGGAASVTSIGTVATSTMPVATATSLAPSSTASATTVEDAAESLLQRRDVPPEAVAAQFELSLGGNGSGELCAGPFPPGPQVVLDRDQRRVIRVEAGGSVRLCLPGFDPAKPIRTELISPSGQGSKEVIPARDQRVEEFDPVVLVENIFEWFPFPTADLGRYTFTATQDNLAASATLVVVLPEGPVVDIEPRRGPPGTEFLVGLAGFQMESEVVLHVYWADPDDAEVEILEYLGSSFYYGRYQYVTSLPIVTDDSGRAAYDLVTQVSDPLGGYCLFARSPPADELSCDASFELASPE